MKIIDQLKQKVPDLAQRGMVAKAFFDDVGLGSQTMEDQAELLNAFLEISRANHLRIKLSKCEFGRLNLEYLGFDLGYLWWKPSRKKV